MRILSLFIFLACSLNVLAQRPKLKVEGITPNLFVIHKVKNGESLNSVASIYNQSVQAVSFINNFKNDDLKTGAEIQIPLDNKNFEQAGQMLPDEVLIPLYHHVANGESLYRIGLNHNKVPVSSIKEWNNLNKETIWAGMQLIVGYLKIKTNQVELLYGEKQTETDVTKKIEEEKPIIDTPVEKTITKKVEEPEYAFANTGFTAGFFEKDYPKNFKDRDSKNLSGEAATFKSISGWNDYKFYILVNDITPGTIVKITANDNIVYAKVLGALPEMKENNGLTFRLSNATTSMLGIQNKKFTISIEYYNF
jgi:LysM repeat protein